MKKSNLLLFVVALVFATFTFTSCKSKPKETTEAPATTTTIDNASVEPAAPVVIAGNEELKTGVMDATKDYPGVKAEVIDSVITLSGEIKREEWQKLNPTLNSLRPKRVNSEALTIK